MSASLKFTNESEFQRDFRALAARTSRGLDVFTNSELGNIAVYAREATPKADRGKIQSDLGATMTGERVNKKGKTVRRYKYKPTPIVYAIINARRGRAGEPGLFGKEMATAARKLIAARLRAVGSLKSGWNRAIGVLMAAAKRSFKREGPNVKLNSDAKTAKPGWKPEVRLDYRVTVENGSAREVDPRVARALEGAFARRGAEMKARLEEKLRADARAVGVKTN